jgi:hypothetical protein
VQVGGQVLSQGEAGRLVIGQARGRVKSLKEPLCLRAAFEDGPVREFLEATGHTVIHIHQLRVGRVQCEKNDSC